MGGIQRPSGRGDKEKYPNPCRKSNPGCLSRGLVTILTGLQWLWRWWHSNDRFAYAGQVFSEDLPLSGNKFNWKINSSSAVAKLLLKVERIHLVHFSTESSLSLSLCLYVSATCILNFGNILKIVFFLCYVSSISKLLFSVQLMLILHSINSIFHTFRASD